MTTTKHTITMTSALRKEINAAVRRLCGANPVAEVGDRIIGDTRTNNALDWTDDSDLYDMTRLADTKRVDVHSDAPNCVMLDLYVTSGIGINRELETNVYVFIRDGHVIGATPHAREVEALRASLNFPKTRGW